LQTDENQFGPFINTSLLLTANSEGLIFKQLNIGTLLFRQPMVQRVVESTLARLLGKQ